ncbi:hypothetical protein XYCOK13_24590 [Xylanibacillus composti]|uniref:N-acetyltransferase domain-containing protein n=1 Tax=Xylanibacillus composti TaxID=1572762 RepID=A0A8J4M315_9BACL|nr:GNAT family N-acetyltransferase [Xylanibacillus composti]GIQ69635.1 hypothetical protein XYCOK13_24590 [Xylanibacillus composti]
MNASMLEAEIAYTKLFAQSEDEGDFIRFWDETIPDMYTHNYILVKHNQAPLAKILKAELAQRHAEGKKFLRAEFSFAFDNSLLDELPIKPNVTHYDYMVIHTDRYQTIQGNMDGRVEPAYRENVLADGIAVDVLANEEAMGLEFAVRRIHRKSKVYQDSLLPLQLYVCYHGKLAVGKCELMILRDIAKIEDFDILENHQRQGFGSTVIRHLLKHAADQHVKQAYLVTNSTDTAKIMYAKCGFVKAGTKTELFFRLENDAP